MKMGKKKERLAEELVKPLPIAEDAADGARLRFLSPSRLSPWLSAQWLARLCLPARLAARVNTCLEETSSPLDREATGENEQHKQTRPAHLFARHGPRVDREPTTFLSRVSSPRLGSYPACYSKGYWLFLKFWRAGGTGH